MQSQWVTVLLWFAALGCGLMAGVYFTFSAFVMAAFARMPAAHGIGAMNAINVRIIRSLFMPLFLGTTLVAAILAGVAVYRWHEPGAIAVLAGGVIYVVGMFAVTMIRNVPLNNALAAMESNPTKRASLWARYLKSWTAWNHVRTVASLTATTLFIFALGV